ncbi:MurR/RpiR family transcriptional regulator [Glaciecola sp. 1036]|uniref:MurR/RpiR family transcriptional regulator n=1 Tax=Alteromonadaceae TaxID=72275 RepID=UPI003CFE4342
MAAFSKIRAVMPKLSNNEQRLANFIVETPTALRDLSSQKLAEIVGISQSSVVKFAQKLNYKGYPALKLAILEDAKNVVHDEHRLHGNIAIEDDYHTMADKLLRSKINVLKQTRTLNEENQIEKAVGYIDNAKRVLVTGLGGSALVGKDFVFKLHKLGVTALSEIDGHAQLALASTLNQDDVVFAISESGATTEVVNVVKEAKKGGSKIISVTKFGDNPISSLANVRLFSVAEEAATRISSILARTAQEFVIDVLFIALMQRYSDRRVLLEKTRDAVSTLRAK